MKEQAVKRIGMGRLADLFTMYPGYSLVDRLSDVVSKRQRLRLIVTSPDYCELRLFWGALTFEKGSKREFLIEGGPGLCDAVMRSLGGPDKMLNVVSQVVKKR